MAIFVLPLLLLVGAVVLGLVASHRGGTDGATRPDHRPLGLPPVEAPDAAGPACTRLLAALPATLTASPAPLPRLALLAPAPAGATAWAGSAADSGSGAATISTGGSTSGSASGDPVVLRCGLPKPPELTNSSALIVINGVSWLNLSQPDRDTFIAVDRPVYVAVTVPRGLGTGPVQTLSDTVRTALPAR